MVIFFLVLPDPAQLLPHDATGTIVPGARRTNGDIQCVANIKITEIGPCVE